MVRRDARVSGGQVALAQVQQCDDDVSAVASTAPSSRGRDLSGQAAGMQAAEAATDLALAFFGSSAHGPSKRQETTECGQPLTTGISSQFVVYPGVLRSCRMLNPRRSPATPALARPMAPRP